MKKSILLLSLLVSSFVFSQNVFWYDVLLELDSKNASTVAGLVDGFYSNHTKSSNVNVEFSSIPLKGLVKKLRILLVLLVNLLNLLLISETH